MLKIICLILLTIILVFPSQALAIFNFSTTNNTTTDTEELSISVNVDLSSSTANNTYYLRGAFYKEGTTQYFGYTQDNGGNFYNGPYGNCQNLYKITVDGDGNWTGEIKVKIDPQNSYFDGSGDYLFKVGRYTESCNITWADSEPVKISITQTVFPSPRPSPSPSQTTTTSSSTSAKSPSPLPKTSPILQSSKSPSPTPKTSPKVLAEKDSQFSTPSAQQEMSSSSPSPSTENSPSKFKVAGLLSGTGLALIGVSFALYLWYSKRLSKTDPKDNEKNI